ncbi:DinB family protein [Mucilaginibacter sp. PAMB04274]|uniref:DinB family protein n=1 Tax=Mucilaginibacter sp. PAMB04274 TaxID=3138568 RepID=UPI00332474D2
MQSPEFVVPSDGAKDKDTLLQQLEATRGKVTQAAAAYDYTYECIGFELLGSGPYTRIEWLYFIIYHTQRHVHQLRNIFHKLCLV